MTLTRRILIGFALFAGGLCVAPSTTHADHCDYGRGRFYVGGYRSVYRPYSMYSYSYRPYSYYSYSPGFAYRNYSYSPGYAYRSFSYANPYAYRPFYAAPPYYSYRPYYGPGFPGYYGSGYRSFYGIGPSFGTYYRAPFYGGRSSYFGGSGFGLYIY